MANNETQQTVDEIFGFYDKYGNDPYFGEPVSQSQHAFQAAELARTEGYDNEVIIAAFLHDIGHLCVEITEDTAMEDLGIKDHELEGANYLRQKGFSDKICRLIGAHVSAKRYLTATNPVYFSNLSEASKRTLEFQGGVMSDVEVIQFEEDPLFSLYIRMRLWDEQAKDPAYTLPDLAFYKKMVHDYLSQSSFVG